MLVLSAIAGLSGGLTGLTGCTAPPAAAPIPLEPDELSVNRAVDAARALRADALTLAGTQPDLAVLLRGIAAGHEEHLVALGGATSADTSASATGSGAGLADPTATADSTPAPTATPSRLIKAEIAAAQVALRDGEAAAPAFALLLCRIAAARIVNADLLSAVTGRKPYGVLLPAKAATPSSAATSAASSSSDRATTDPADPETGTAADPETGTEADSLDPTGLTEPGTPAQIALARLLAGEHAAVFAYPLILARAAANRRNLASALWEAHLTEREELSNRLLSAGIQPTVAEPAYDVGTPPTNSAKAAALAALVERGLAALASDLLAAGDTGDDDRVLGADQLVLAARRTANWTGKPIAFPGLVAGNSPSASTAPAAFTPTEPSSTP